MKDKIEQLFISAIQGEWDSEYFAERMMELMLPYIDVYRTKGQVYKDVQIASIKSGEIQVIFWNDGKYYSDLECTKELPKIENFKPADEKEGIAYKITTGIIHKNYDKNT